MAGCAGSGEGKHDHVGEGLRVGIHITDAHQAGHIVLVNLKQKEEKFVKQVKFSYVVAQIMFVQA